MGTNLVDSENDSEIESVQGSIPHRDHEKVFFSFTRIKCMLTDRVGGADHEYQY